MQYSYIKRRNVGGRVYLYAVHYLGYKRDPVSGKIRKITKECYLGPEESYEYVTRMHNREGLILRGLSDEDRAIEYLDALIRFLETHSLRPEFAKNLASKLEELAKRLREAIKYEEEPRENKKRGNTGS